MNNNLELTPLTAISPIDGRYWKTAKVFAEIFSEHGLQKGRVYLEVMWLIFLGKSLKLFNIYPAVERNIFSIYQNYSIKDTRRIKVLEKKTNHDVKAVEYFVKEKLKKLKLDHLKEWVHIGLTSEDDTNVAIACMICDGLPIIEEALEELITKLESLAKAEKAISMLSHTHGQPASPTTIGKEMINFANKLREEQEILSEIPIRVKINCATGNFSALHAVFPQTDWISAITDFIIDDLNFAPNLFTVQTNSYNYVARIMHSLVRIASIIIDLDRDMWEYISRNYFLQIPKPGETGSSTMPHKVNPIDFENSEGNLEFVVPIAENFATKLLKTRMQRDLTDSTFLRNTGVVFAHMLIAIKSTLRGFGKVRVNDAKLIEDLEKNQAILAEPIQTLMRMRGEKDPYEKLKNLTRGKEITKKDLNALVQSCKKLTAEDKQRMIDLTPATYTGLAEKLVDLYFDQKNQK